MPTTDPNRAPQPASESASGSGHRVLLLFVDGIGLAPAAATNPLSTAPMPALHELLGGPLTTATVQDAAQGAVQQADGLLLRPVDACLGVEGLPQSATGQTSLFTGVNAPAHMGRHVTAFPGPQLRAVLAEHSVFRRAASSGERVTFANPFGPAYFRALEDRRRRGHSASTWAVLAMGLEGPADDPTTDPAEALEVIGHPTHAPALLRGLDDLRADRAVTWDVTRARFRTAEPAARQPGSEIPRVTPEEAGRHLAALAGAHHLTLWETFLTDLAGHRRWGLDGEEVLTRLDGLLGGLLSHRPADLTVVLTSDHGNLEDATHKVHTRNPVPLLAVGPAADHFAEVEAITGVAPAILAALGAA